MIIITINIRNPEMLVGVTVEEGITVEVVVTIKVKYIMVHY